MEGKSDVVPFKEYIENPLINALNYVTLRKCSDPTILRVYVIFLVVSVFYLFYSCVKLVHRKRKISIPERLYKAAADNDIVKCIRIVQKYPDAMNAPLYTDGYTPFMKACLNGNTQIVKYMINAGADLRKKSANSESPFYLAIYNHIKNPIVKNASCIHALYYAGADINEVNDKGYSPLQMAAAFGHTSLVKWLLTKGADTNISPDPYMIAFMQGHTQTAHTLKNEHKYTNLANR